MSIKTSVTNMFKKLIIVLMLPLFLIGCSGITGEEIGRLEIDKVSTKTTIIDKEVALDLKKGDEIAFWSDMDMEYEGELQLRFRVKIFKNGSEMSEIKIDPMKKSITLGETKTSLITKTKWSFLGKNSALEIKEDATYAIKGILISSENPSLKINKADLVIKK